MTSRTPHPLNVPGDFYVEDNCCLICDIPRTIAPDLFALEGGNEHCFVKHQPTSQAEIDRMHQAISTAELQCIRYLGKNRQIQIRLVEENNAAICDHLDDSLKLRAMEVETRELRQSRKR
jgi:hypothetical protein